MKVDPKPKESLIGESGFGRKRLTINTLASGVYYILLIGVGFWYTPFMLARIPESIYGLVPLATSMTSQLAIIMTLITGPIGRYVTADLARGDLEGANATFNSFFFGGAKIIAAMLLVVIGFCIVLPVKVPPGYESMARLLFASIGVSLILSSFSSCFETTYWVTNRFEIRSIVDISILLLRNSLIVVLFYFFRADLWQICVAVVVTSMVQLYAGYRVMKSLAPQLRVDPTAQTGERKKLIYQVGRWLLVANVGFQIIMSSDLFLINRFFGTTENTKYSVLLLLATILRGVFASVGQLLIPSLVAMEATQSPEDIVRAMAKTMRLFGTIAAHVTGTMSGLALPFLLIWVRKPWVGEIAPLAWIILLPLCFEVLSMPLTSFLIAPERIARYAIASVVCAAAGLVTAITLLLLTDLHYYAVAIAIAGASIARHWILNGALATSGAPAPWHYFIRIGIPTILRFAATAIVAYMIGQWIQPGNLLYLGVCATLALAATAPLSFLSLPGNDRQTVLRFLRPAAARV